jgi:hypothetical protein
MRSHSEKIKESIDHMLIQLYPTVRQRFKLIHMACEFDIYNRDQESNAIIDLLKEIEREFLSLYTYETRLVFPSILSLFDNCKTEQQNYHSNINDLVYLTQKRKIG